MSDKNIGAVSNMLFGGHRWKEFWENHIFADSSDLGSVCGSRLLDKLFCHYIPVASDSSIFHY